MRTLTRRYTSLQGAVQDVHMMFQQWENDSGSASPEIFRKHPALLHKARLALHEWLANLAQHAEFRNRRPEILITLAADSCKFFCSIRDNSEGFDLEEYSQDKVDVFAAFPERGMGLQIIKKCAPDVSYERIDSEYNLLTLSVRPTTSDG